MIPDIIHMKTSGRGSPKIEKGKPDPSRLLSGKRLTQTWNLGVDARQGAGVL
jgi:hypothetical protein